MKLNLINCLCFILLSISQVTEIYCQETTKGIYGSPSPLWERNYSLPELGINAIFVHSGSINSSMMQKARHEGVKIYAEFPVLNGKNYVEKHPDAWPINEKGEKAEAASWFMGVCPTNVGFKTYRLKELDRLIATYEVDGIWMDYVHWHAQFEEPEPILPETCFCNDCISGFEVATGINVPQGSISDKSGWIFANHDDDWRKWRCEVIVQWVDEFKKIINERNSQILLGLYHCPWNDDEFNGARRRILGLDYDLLRNKIDVFSPMVYHGRMDRDPSWVKENILWFSDRLESDMNNKPLIWPIVQAHDDPVRIPAEEFRKVMLGGLSGNSTGIMMFTSYSVAEDPEKIRVLKELYHSLDKN